MKNFLVISGVVLFAASAMAQASDVSSPNQTDVKGCLGGGAGSYSLIEEQTGSTYNIAGSAVDLKPHLGHEVELIAQVVGKGSSPSIRVSELKMISEHCSSAAIPSGSSSTAVASASAPAAPHRKRAMPNTASPLPLLGVAGFALALFGLGSLRKRKVGSRSV